MHAVSFDLESIANKDVIPLLPPIEDEVKLGNLKDPVKIQAKMEEAEQKRIDRMGLSPFTGRVCCVGIAYMNEDKVIKSSAITISEDTDDAERELLDGVFQRLDTFAEYYTFNGNPFDVPFLKGRALILQPDRRIPKISTAKYRVTNHIDVRAILSNYDQFAKGTLDFYSSVILGHNKADGIDGSMVQGLWNEGKIKDIADYCKKECGVIYQLGELVKKFYI